MAEETKPVEVPKTEEAAVEPVPAVAETKPVETAATEAAPAETAATTSETPAAEPAAEAAAPAEEAKKEVTPIEEGHLEHKGKGANFPK
jgi:hypothetical protein